MSGHVLDARRWRDAIALFVALVGGLAIAWIDASPGWDDTAITAGLLLLAAFLAALLSGRRPWFWALMVGLPAPLVEIAQGGDPAALAALAFAAVGSAIGYSLGRVVGPGQNRA